MYHKPIVHARRILSAGAVAVLFCSQLPATAQAAHFAAPNDQHLASASLPVFLNAPAPTYVTAVAEQKPDAAPGEQLTKPAKPVTDAQASNRSVGHQLWIWLAILAVVFVLYWVMHRANWQPAEIPRYRPGFDPYDVMRPRGRILTDSERRARRDYDSEYFDEPPLTSDQDYDRRYPEEPDLSPARRPSQLTPPAVEESMQPRYRRQSQATLVLPTDAGKKTFADVAGQDETVARLREICNWLKQPEIYNRHNAELPRGVMFVGPPGTGKTLCAQALAGETHGSMFITAASSFVEMYVGVGASRVRALFADAKAQRKQTNKPVIIFIDELDAVGGARNNGSSSNSEREQTLNQLLVEMDGFTKNEGIIVIAATNRVDMLDPALRRKGRFDLEVQVELPDLNGREAIFKVHTRDKPIDAAVDFKLLAKRTFGMSGADLKAAANEAAIIAARLQSELEAAGTDIGQTKTITTAMFDEAISIVESGEARRERFKSMSLEDKKQTAYHELGHAVVIHKTGADTITKITILPRGRALGYVQTHTENDRYNLTDVSLRKRITAAMAGRIAQEIFMQTVDTGASSDFEQANRLARKMVSEFGMSKLGPLYLPEGRANNVGAVLSNQIDEEVRLIISECAAQARIIIEDNRHEIESLVELLLERETIFGHDFVAVFEAAASR